MPDVRGAILRGTREAARLHRQLALRTQIERQGGRIDVFDAIAQCGLPMLFRPLDGLLGVFISEPTPGVLVTTQRPASVQRFTGAHELGHYRMGHRPSLDDETILRRSPFSAQANYEQQELEADVFAAEFLMPRWLFAAHFERQGWTDRTIDDPKAAYQLSLRVGASYDATCRALERHRIIGRRARDRLLRVQPKQIKQILVRDYEPPDWWGDVWLLTERDEGSVIAGSRSDLFILRLNERSGAGYLWTFEQLNEAGFAIVRDEREGPEAETIGGDVIRSVIAQSAIRQQGDLALAQRRPWLPESAPLTEFGLHYDLSGPEQEGFSQAERRQLLEAA